MHFKEGGVGEQLKMIVTCGNLGIFYDGTVFDVIPYERFCVTRFLLLYLIVNVNLKCFFPAKKIIKSYIMLHDFFSYFISFLLSFSSVIHHLMLQ